MKPGNFPEQVLDTALQHLAPDAQWVPLAAVGMAALLGLVFLVKGARLTPWLIGLVFALSGAAVGGYVADRFAFPTWPLVIVSGTVGVVLGVLLFRFWFALVVAGCAIAAGLGMYSDRVLKPTLDQYASRGLTSQDDGPGVTLPEGEAVADPNLPAEAVSLWTYLSDNVNNFQVSFFAITIATGAAGLAFALLLPKAARAFWAATVGVFLFLPAVYGLLHLYWPAGAAWLKEWGFLVASIVWAISLLYNLADVLDWRRKKKAVAADSSEAATA